MTIFLRCWLLELYVGRRGLRMYVAGELRREKGRVWIAKHHPFITWLQGVTARWLLVAACAADCYLLPQSSYPHFLVETRLPSTGDSASFTSWQFSHPLGNFVLGFWEIYIFTIYSRNYIQTIKAFLGCCYVLDIAIYAKSTVPESTQHLLLPWRGFALQTVLIGIIRPSHRALLRSSGSRNQLQSFQMNCHGGSW